MQSFYIPFLLVICLVVACQEGKVKETVKAMAEGEEFTYAKDLYQKHCVACHEATISAFVNRIWKRGNSWNEVHQSIKIGHKGIEKVAFADALSDSDYNKLTDYILSAIEKRTIASFEEEPDWTGTIRSEVETFKLDTVVRGLKIPWGLAFLPNGDLLVTDRSGKFYRKQEGADLRQIRGVPAVKYKGQGGLLDVEVHPDFASNQTIYLAYSKPKGISASTTAILKAKLVNDALTEKEIILEALPYRDTRHHYGCRMAFDKDGYLFISIGDRGKRDENPQSLDNHCGKIHRINADGSIPKDNPFVSTPNAIPSIWSYGHRNQQGLVIDDNTGTVWSTEHGPRGGDELNIIQKGLNYGWPIISYGINYSGTRFTNLTKKEGMEQPVFYYLPSIGACGLTLVTGDKYPDWTGSLLSGSLRFQYISRLKMKNNQVTGEERLLENIGRLREIVMGKDGYIYFTVEDPGFVFRLTPV